MVKQSIVTCDKESFAFPINSLFLTNIKSPTTPNMYAIIKIIREVATPVSTRVVFDIDTHLEGVYNINNEATLKERLLDLKEFKK